jgi:hypothetical protein
MVTKTWYLILVLPQLVKLRSLYEIRRSFNRPIQFIRARTTLHVSKMFARMIGGKGKTTVMEEEITREVIYY